MANDDGKPYEPPLRGRVASMPGRPLPTDEKGAGAGQSKVQTAREKLATRAPEIVDEMMRLALDSPEIEHMTNDEGSSLPGVNAKLAALKLAATYALRKPRPEADDDDAEKDETMWQRIAHAVRK